MPRTARKQFAGARYHVTNRGNGRLPLFYRPDDYERFLDQLREALARDGVVLYAYCLMPNHVHLFVETPRANVGRFMGRLTTAYAMYFRYKHYRPGHCFQGRYKAPLVAGDEYLLRLTRYIHLNPVKTEETATWSAERKWAHLRQYRWSSLSGYVGRDSGDVPVDYRWLGLLEPRGARRARAAYARYLRAMLGAEDNVLLEAMRASGYALGDEAFRREVEQWVRGQADEWAERSDVDVPALPPVPLERIAAAVAEAYGVRPEALPCARKRVGMARGVFIELACTLGGLTQRGVARRLGTMTEHGVGKQRGLVRAALAGDARLRAEFDALRDRINSRL
jgi:REP element-mobilizing transposase RayT